MTLENRALLALSSSLVGDDPRRAIDRACQALHSSSEAEGLALILPSGSALTLLVGRDFPIDSDTGLSGLIGKVDWDNPSVVEDGHQVIAPLGAGVKGVLVLLRPRELDRRALQLYQLVIGQAVAALPRLQNAIELAPRTIGAYLGELSSSDAQKAQLLAALERHEWNVALVARKLRVTRRTIYLRLAKYGIERKRVPKHYKKIRDADA